MVKKKKNKPGQNKKTKNEFKEGCNARLFFKLSHHSFRPPETWKRGTGTVCVL